jgi:hypothetical protein
MAPIVHQAIAIVRIAGCATAGVTLYAIPFGHGGPHLGAQQRLPLSPIFSALLYDGEKA